MDRITDGFPGYGGTCEDAGETDCRAERLLPNHNVGPELGVLCVSAVKSFANNPG